MADVTPVLSVEDLVLAFPSRSAGTDNASFRAVDRVSFEIAPGNVLGLVGESGSGKTTIGKTVLRLNRPSGGRILFSGHDIGGMNERQLRPLRPRMQMVFQDPLSSF